MGGGLTDLVYFDARQNSLLGQELYKRSAIISLLPEGLIVKDDTTNVVLNACKE